MTVCCPETTLISLRPCFISMDYQIHSKWQQFLPINARTKINRQQKLTDSRMPLLAAFLSWFSNEALMKARHLVLHCPPQQDTASVKISKSYPPSSEYLCANDRISDARPLPSHITTGRGGSSRRHSNTMEITLGPPSTMSPTTGTPCPSPAKTTRTETKKVVSLKPSLRG